jgi:hypothetical protein
MERPRFVLLFVAWNALLQFCHRQFYHDLGPASMLSDALNSTKEVWETAIMLTLPSALTNVVDVLVPDSLDSPRGVLTAVLLIGVSWPIAVLLYKRAQIYGWKKVGAVFVAVSAVISAAQAFIFMRIIL